MRAMTISLAVAVALLGARAEAAPRVMGKTTASQLAAAGEGALLTLMVDGRRFGPLKRTLRLLEGALSPYDQRRLAGALQKGDPWELLGALVLGRRMDARAIWNKAQWDRSRPLIFALFEPELAAELANLRLALPVFEQRPRMIRHRMLVPIEGSAASVLAALRQVVRNRSNLRETPTRLEAVMGRETIVAIVEKDHVRVELAETTRRPKKPASWIRRVALPPAAGLAPRTPARSALEQSKGAVVSAYARPWQAPAVVVELASRQLRYALRYSSASARQRLYSRGLAEVLGGWLLLEPSGVEVDDLALTLRATKGLIATAQATVTEQGQKVFDAGVRAAHRGFAVRGKAVLKAGVTVGLKAMLDAAAGPRSLSGLGGYEMRRALRRAGAFALLALLAQRPAGLGRALLGVLPAPLHSLAPGALAVAVDAEPGSRSFRWRIGGAASLAGNAALDQLVGRLPFFRLSLRKRARAGGKVAWLVGTSPALDKRFRDAAKKSPLGWAELDLLRLAAEVRDPGPRALLRALKRARASLQRPHARVLGATLSLGAHARAAKMRVRGATAWSSPAAAEARSKGARCLFELTQTMQQALYVVPRAHGAAAQKVLTAARTKAAQQLPCVAADPRTRDEAQRMQMALELFEIERLFWQRDKMLRQLRKTCSKGNKAACVREIEVKGMPSVKLARGKGGAALEPSLIRWRRSALLGPKGKLPKRARELAVDASTPYARLKTWIDTVAGDDLSLIFRGKGGARAVRVTARKQRPLRPENDHIAAFLGHDRLELAFRTQQRKIGGLLWSGSENDLEHLQRVARKLKTEGAEKVTLIVNSPLLWSQVLPVIAALDSAGLKVAL